MFSLHQKLFSVNKSTFEEVALEVFRFQYEVVPIYKVFCDAFAKTPQSVNQLADIPFLPIEFFKNHVVQQHKVKAQEIFESSGTTNAFPSRHYVADLRLYEQSFLAAFELFYGNPQQYTILALLPSYLERKNSSLVYMVERLIQLSGKTESGFYLNEWDKLFAQLSNLKTAKRKTILLGVTFGLLDFAEQHTMAFPELIVMETGGMKGRREELTREEVHLKLSAAFGVECIHSEYGMTELLSQAYSKGDGKFQSPPWMKLLVRNLYDPLTLEGENKTGAINIIDLANIYSCSFIATDDIGKIDNQGFFEVLGRVDRSEMRGCNLMIN